ncbi:MAG: RluA family pseudouridine synthase [Mucinivorans sp.]
MTNNQLSINQITTNKAETEEDQDELFEHFSTTVDRGQGLLRIDKYLYTKLENTSRARIQTAADNGYVLVNSVAVKSSYRVKPLDKVQIMMPYEPRDVEITPENIPLDILFEDADILVVNKPSGLVVHPGHGNYSGTLVNALAYHLQGTPIFEDRGDLRAGLVHRIDKNTSGVLVVAKNTLAHSNLAAQFFNHTIQRTYHALVWGDFADNEGTIEGNIGRSPKNRLQMAILEPDNPNGKHAVTHYKVLERLGYVTLVECKLETGRTHQIRVHMKHIGHPLFNDERYGGDCIVRGTTFTKYKQYVANCFEIMPRHGLHALSLGFIHPTSGEFMQFCTQYPADFAACLDKWRAYGAGTTE